MCSWLLFPFLHLSLSQRHFQWDVAWFDISRSHFFWLKSYQFGGSLRKRLWFHKVGKETIAVYLNTNGDVYLPKDQQNWTWNEWSLLSCQVLDRLAVLQGAMWVVKPAHPRGFCWASTHPGCSCIICVAFQNPYVLGWSMCMGVLTHSRIRCRVWNYMMLHIYLMKGVIDEFGGMMMVCLELDLTIWPICSPLGWIIRFLVFSPISCWHLGPGNLVIG